MKIWSGAAVGLLGLSGCLAVHQTDYPEVSISAAAANAPAVALSGFEATVTSYIPVYGYATVWNSTPGYYHRGHYHAGWAYPETVSTTTYVPQSQKTTAFAEKAQDALETAGYVVTASNAAYTINVKFDGPVVTDGDRTAEVATVILSLLTTDYTCASWSARLKVTENATGRVVFSQNYVQEYSACAIGLIPLFGPLSCEKVQSDYIQGWCLSALTDRTMADVTAFLSSIVPQGVSNQ